MGSLGLDWDKNCRVVGVSGRSLLSDGTPHKIEPGNG